MGVFIVYQLSILSFSCSSTARSTAHMEVYVRCMFQRDAILRLWFLGAISSPNVNGTNVPCIYLQPFSTHLKHLHKRIIREKLVLHNEFG